MKRTMIALAVVAMTMGSVQAAEVYALDGVTVNLTGQVEVNYLKTQSEDQDLELNLEEANFGFGMSYEMTEDFSVSANMNIDANNTDDDVTRGDVFMSLKYKQAHTLSFGSQSTILDDAGIGDDYEFGFTSYVDSLDTDGDQVIKYKYDGGEVFYGGIAYSAYANETDQDDDYQVDAKVGVRAEDLDFTLYLANGELLNDAETANLSETTAAFEARYTVGDITLAGTYARSSAEQEVGSDVDIDIFGFAATYWDGGRIEYAAGWANIDNPTVQDDKFNDFYVNATYTFTDQVSAYAELGLTDEDNTDVGYVVGMNATF